MELLRACVLLVRIAALRLRKLGTILGLFAEIIQRFYQAISADGHLPCLRLALLPP
jgi:hypothetical protein